MASPAFSKLDTPTEVESDYGSEFSTEEEEIVNQLLASVEVLDDNPVITDVEYHGRRQAVRIPRLLGTEKQYPHSDADTEDMDVIITRSTSTSLPFDPGYPDLSKVLAGSPADTPKLLKESPENSLTLEPAPPAHIESDPRSPLERFRTQPQKAMSVTDLVSPAWCELQYWYTLTTHGRKKRTAAMKRGSAIHQQLEDKLYRTVEVNVETKEDSWGLRIWNVIKGLQTLRETGQTRELEVWGVIEGQVVNGVIDELSFECPDSEMGDQIGRKTISSKDDMPENQRIISDFFQAPGGRSLEYAQVRKQSSHNSKVYLCDVKTRATASLPNAISFRPTKMQLMLYHHLLSSLAIGNLDFSILASRYELDADTPFSDSFLAQMGSLDDEVFYDATSVPDSDSGSLTQDSMAILLSHNSLAQLWALMMAEFQHTLPNGSGSIGNTLKAEYRSRDDGQILGTKIFTMNVDVMNIYLEHGMQWWSGKREPEGVIIEEAFKCRSCDFAETCEWRLSRADEALQKSRTRRKGSSGLRVNDRGK